MGSRTQNPDAFSSRAVRVDPSVKETDLYQKGEPRGSVPMSTTMQKPEAYKPSKGGPK